MALWIDISKIIKGKSIEKLHHKDSTLSTLYSDESSTPPHIRFGFGALSEKEVSQSIEKLSEILKEL